MLADHCCRFCYQGSGMFVFTAPHPLGPWKQLPGVKDLGCQPNASEEHVQCGCTMDSKYEF